MSIKLLLAGVGKKRTLAACQYLLARTKQLISVQRMPGTYPAVPGAPPMRVSGRLVKSGRAYVRKDGTGVVSFGAPYAAFLENDNHPFLLPIVRRERTNILRILKS